MTPDLEPEALKNQALTASLLANMSSIRTCTSVRSTNRYVYTDVERGREREREIP